MEHVAEKQDGFGGEGVASVCEFFDCGRRVVGREEDAFGRKA